LADRDERDFRNGTFSRFIWQPVLTRWRVSSRHHHKRRVRWRVVLARGVMGTCSLPLNRTLKGPWPWRFTAG